MGALKKFVALQDTHDCVFCVVDLHAITVPQDPKTLADNTRKITAAFLAAGLDPKKAVIFVQSAVRAHSELAWIFNCSARMGWLERMTQFKDKAGKDKERASVGLFAYPVLQAADILAYKATHVPVGEDQKQHLELSRDIAERFNRDYDAPGFFPLPEPLIKGPGARIMSLKDGTKKMSKSDPSDLSRINLEDDADTIARKIKKGPHRPGPAARKCGGPERSRWGRQSGGYLCGPCRDQRSGRAGRVCRSGLWGLQTRPGRAGRAVHHPHRAGAGPGEC
ncbi:MAG: tryptophan--tRNA ligase [Robiginitomaculum sp.]|nr:tryptophan--tRNA ligase [Robiginitomaculum sp.]